MTVTGNRKSTGDTSRPAGQRAAEQACERTSIHVTLPALGRINLGPPEQLAYFAGIATLTALEIIEWPVAVILATGHLLAEQRRSNTLHAFGAALEQI
jgi:hypothetical protein